MDHHQQHHEKHVHEREHRKAEQRERERAEEKDWLPFHPAWVVVVGAVLVLIAILVWTLLF